jgi:hypothetical protein
MEFELMVVHRGSSSKGMCPMLISVTTVKGASVTPHFLPILAFITFMPSEKNDLFFYFFFFHLIQGGGGLLMSNLFHFIFLFSARTQYFAWTIMTQFDIIQVCVCGVFCIS